MIFIYIEVAEMTFKDRLRQLRISEKLTQNELAKKVEIPYSTLRSYEAGSRAPSLENFIKIQKFFNVSAEYLRDEDNNTIIGNENDPLLLNLVLGKVNRVMKHYQADLLKSDNDRQQTANFLLDSWVNIIIRSVLQNDDLEDPHFYMKVAESLNSLNSDGFLEVCKRINELSRLDEYKSTQK
ncbi:helix-turn-helix transcriptional regulator [[Clostridium] innocuum]|nr:helix-turn-helix transcriptional regulator [[Clostridium] innocuum]